MVQCGAVIALGGGLGLAIGRRVSPMQLPQTVAALHSVVGLAAVMTSAGSVLGSYEVGHGKAEAGSGGAGQGAKVEEKGKGHGLGGLHLTTAYLGVLIGGVTFTGTCFCFLKGIDTDSLGSILAFLKLAGRMSSRPLVLPGRHYINGGLLATNLGCMAGCITMAPTAPMIGASLLAANTALSFAKGWTTSGMSPPRLRRQGR
jgi:NAD(P) transhydrogenase